MTQKKQKVLARKFHTLPIASPYLLASAALRSFGLLDVLHEYVSASLSRKPCIHKQLRRLMTTIYEISGLVVDDNRRATWKPRLWRGPAILDKGFRGAGEHSMRCLPAGREGVS